MQLRRLGRIESELRLGSLITVWTALATRRSCWERSSARLCCPPEAVTVRLTLPERCKLCGAIGSVVPETTITGGVVLLKWFCRTCAAEWPMTKAEQQMVEGREAQPDPATPPESPSRGRHEKS